MSVRSKVFLTVLSWGPSELRVARSQLDRKYTSEYCRGGSIRTREYSERAEIKEQCCLHVHRRSSPSNESIPTARITYHDVRCTVRSTARARLMYSTAVSASCPLRSRFSRCVMLPSMSDKASDDECSSTQHAYSASCQP